MANLAYREVYTMNPTETRKLLIKAYHETKSISKTARMWKTSRDVIRKWVRPPGAEGPPSGLALCNRYCTGLAWTQRFFILHRYWRRSSMVISFSVDIVPSGNIIICLRPRGSEPYHFGKILHEYRRFSRFSKSCYNQ